MMRATNKAQTLLTALARPRDMSGFSPAAWEELFYQGMRGALQGALAQCACRADVTSLPPAARDHFEAAGVVAAYNRRRLGWEINRLALALSDIEAPVVLLKGAAYHMHDLALATRRLVSDIDILVPKDSLADVEAALVAHGWESLKQDPYDERYYRQWMHEIPPLRHRHRGSIVDVHHTILPESGRLSADTAYLFANAVPAGDGGFLTLAPADMTLHAIVHWIQDGEVNGRLRDLVDIHEMLTEFATHDGFWDDLLAAGRAHGFARPLYYALYFARTLLDTDVPAAVWAKAQVGRPPLPCRAIMKRAVPAAVQPDPLGGTPMGTKLARLFLFIRAHWLRMPPHILVMHLGRKALMRLQGRA